MGHKLSSPHFLLTFAPLESICNDIMNDHPRKKEQYYHTMIMVKQKLMSGTDYNFNSIYKFLYSY